MSMLLRRYHKKPEPQQETVENVTPAQLAEHMKNPAFAKAFKEEVAEVTDQLARRAAEYADAQEMLAEEARQSGALESELE